jgi:hypothetical protein
MATPTLNISSYSTILGGLLNSAATKNYIFVGGGNENIGAGISSSVGGGQNNSSRAPYSTIVSGYNNITKNQNNGFIGNGNANYVKNSKYGFIVNGKNNSFQYNTMSGSFVENFAPYGTILNGVNNDIVGFYSAATTYSAFSIIGQGRDNLIDYAYGTILNGVSNSVKSFGSAIANGTGNTLSHPYTFIGVGLNGISRNTGATIHAVGTFSTAGDAQVENVVARQRTTNATTANLGVGPSLSVIKLSNNSAVAVYIPIKAVQVAGISGTVGDSWFHELRVLVKRIAGTTSIVGSVSDTTIAEDAGATTWTATVSVSAGVDEITIEVTGQTNKTINWVADVELVEAAY